IWHQIDASTEIGSFLSKTTEQCSFSRVQAISLNFSLLLIKALRVEANLGMRIKASKDKELKLKGITVSFVASGAFSTTGGEIEGPSYETPLQVVIAFISFFGLATVLPRRVPELEGDAPWRCLFELGKVGRACGRYWEWWRVAGKGGSGAVSGGGKNGLECTVIVI
nr:hypothetical protein [Tanacetum cinerariifolium]